MTFRGVGTKAAPHMHRRIELVNDNSAAASFYTALAGKKLVRRSVSEALHTQGGLPQSATERCCTAHRLRVYPVCPSMLMGAPIEIFVPRITSPEHALLQVRFQQYAALFPEAAFVFLGDNGQVKSLSATMNVVAPCILACTTLSHLSWRSRLCLTIWQCASLSQGDVLVAEALAKIFARMAGRDGGPNRLCACFIHDVVPPPRQPVSGLRETVQDDTALRSAWASQRIFHGGTYVGLAIQVLMAPAADYSSQNGHHDMPVQ